MSDLISRQAAIDALEERLKANGYSNVALVSEFNRSIGYLMRLPSAQPEITEKQVKEYCEKRCLVVLSADFFHHLQSAQSARKKGKFIGTEYDGYDKYPMCLEEAINYIYRTPRWIPVSERLPEDEEDVLVTRHFLSDNQLKKNAIKESFYVEVASRIDDEWTSYSDEYKIKKHLHKVIAWMPLPEPYKEGQK